MRAVLASIFWTALSATLLSTMLLTQEGRETRLLPTAAVVAVGYAALALSAIRPSRAALRRRGVRRARVTPSALPVEAPAPQPMAATSALADRS